MKKSALLKNCNFYCHENTRAALSSLFPSHVIFRRGALSDNKSHYPSHTIGIWFLLGRNIDTQSADPSNEYGYDSRDSEGGRVSRGELERG